MTTYRCAVIGCGNRSYWHARSYALVNRGELVACCDLQAERREKYAAEFNIKAYADAAEMIANEKPDLLHVVTPPTIRAGIMRFVSDLDVPACIMEKPIAYKVSDWRDLCELERTSNTRFGVSAQFRYHAGLTRCRQALRSGELGRLLFLDASAGGTIADQGVHTLDWAMSLNEDVPAVRIFGAASGAAEMAGRHPSPENTVAQIEFANGVYALWNLGSQARRVLDDPAYFKHCRVAAYAERGRTLYEEFRGWEIVSPAGAERGEAVDMDAWRQGNLQAQANLTNAMFDWLEGGAPVGTNLRRSLEQWNTVLGLYASAVYRKPVDLPFDPPDDLWEMLGRFLQ